MVLELLARASAVRQESEIATINNWWVDASGYDYCRVTCIGELTRKKDLGDSETQLPGAVGRSAAAASRAGRTVAEGRVRRGNGGAWETYRRVGSASGFWRSPRNAPIALFEKPRRVSSMCASARAEPSTKCSSTRYARPRAGFLRAHAIHSLIGSTCREHFAIIRELCPRTISVRRRRGHYFQ